MRDERGFTLPAVLGIITVGLLLGMVAFTAAQAGNKTSGKGRDDKQAYAAAEAGVNWYLSRLVFDNAFWAKCTSVAGPAAPVNDDGVTEAARLWRTIPDSTAKYSIDLVPANKKARCETSDPNGTMVDSSTRTFKIRATGDFNGERASLVASFRRARFLDFVYLTNYETTDPLNYPSGSSSTAAACKDKYRTQRDAISGTPCLEIQFAAEDVIKGPLHSDDSLLTCGATFGRTQADQIETSAASPGWRTAGSSCGAPKFVGQLKPGVGTVPMPDTNDEIAANAQSDWKFKGKTSITMNGSTLTVTKRDGSTTTGWPPNGLIYVDQDTDGCSSQPPQRIPAYTGSSAESAGCANVFVDGTYAKDITVASSKDVIVDDDVTKQAGTDAVAGLIAGRFVRTYHPVSGINSDASSCTNTSASNAVQNLTIQAAILAVNNSFTVDNYGCGAGLGVLNVTGGIAQRYRGAVARGNTGYDKNYVYDDRFVYRNPPFFLEPANATWRVVRVAEQVPAVGTTPTPTATP